MSFENLIGISLERIPVDKVAVDRLILAAERNIADANILALSSESRFDLAYKAIMQIANAALQIKGYRTLTSKPGHHQTMIQCLSKTINIDNQTIIILDAMRKQRNVADYSGDTIPESAARDCVSQAEKLVSRFKEIIRLC